jgi:group I intron endonuclease
MNNQVAVYKISNTVNTKLYFGITSNICNRWSTHKRRAKRNYKSFLYNAMVKHGVENFKFEVIHWCNSREDANELEKFLILECETISKGYNLQSGGDSFNHAESTKKLISKIQKGKILSDEHKKKISQSLLGVKKPVRTEEHKEKIRQTLTGHKRSAESVEKTRQGNLGKKYPNRPPQSEETKAKRAIGIKAAIQNKKDLGTYVSPSIYRTRESYIEMGKKFLGQKRSEETKKKISENKKAYYAKKRAGEL